MFNTDGVITFKKVLIKDIYGSENPGQIKIISRTFTQCVIMSFQRSGKIIGCVLLIAPIAIFIHILLALSIFAILTAIGLFFWGLGSMITFESVTGLCPKCATEKALTPYGTARIKFPLQVHCPQCGGVYLAILF